MKTPAFIALAGALALAACDNTAEETQGTDGNLASGEMRDSVPMNAPTDQAEMPGSPQEFVDMQAASDMFEIESAQLAQEMGSSQAVKDFAAMMIEDHSAATDNLKSAAAEAQPALTASPSLTSAQQAQLDELRQAGERFDTVYKQQQTAAHEKALAMLRSYADSDGPEPLKSFAAETAPIVEGHLERVRDLSTG